jgi:ABC-type uncharacterized transport system permease subunit
MWNNILMIIFGIILAYALPIGVIGFSYIVYLIYYWIEERIRRWIKK